MSSRSSYYLFLIVSLGIAIRIIGITHGFPFIFHPDEPTIVRSALDVRFHINPAHFDWPHLYIYFNYFMFMVFAKFRDLLGILKIKEYTYFIAPIIWNDNLIFYLLSRGFTAIIGGFTCLPIFLTVKKLFNEKAGLFAALALAITPYHVWQSHYALPDIPMVFFLAWGIYFTSLILFKKEIMNYILAGFFIGLAASTKYNGLLAIVVVLIAHFLRIFSSKTERFYSLDSFEDLVFTGFFSVLGFVFGTPFAVIDYQTFIRTDGPKGALWQFTNVGKVDLQTHFYQFIRSFVLDLPENFGYSLMILFGVGIFYLLYVLIRYRSFLAHKDLWLFLLSSLVLVWIVSGSERDRTQYYLVCYPVIIIFAVCSWYKITENVAPNLQHFLWTTIFLIPLFFSGRNAYLFYQSDTRVQLYNWIKYQIDSPRPLYTNDKDLKLVFEKIKNPTSFVSESFVPDSAGFFISVDMQRADLKSVISFNNYLRRGPNINVYQSK